MYTRLIQTKAQWFYSRHFVEFCKMFSNELQTDSDTTALIVEFIIQQEYHTYFIFIAAAIAEGKKRNENNLNVNHKSTYLNLFCSSSFAFYRGGQCCCLTKIPVYLFICTVYDAKGSLSQYSSSLAWKYLKWVRRAKIYLAIHSSGLCGANVSCGIK